MTKSESEARSEASQPPAQLKQFHDFSILQKRKRSIGDRNQRASKHVTSLASNRRTRSSSRNSGAVKHREPKPLRPSVTGLCEEWLALARCDCQSRYNH